MVRLRFISAIALSLLIALTSASMAVARGQTLVAGQIVICTGYAYVTIDVDSEGQPVGPRHVCPDCALSLLNALNTPFVFEMPEFEFGQAFVVEAEIGMSGAALFALQARGPPRIG
jgi:hypothetical protein